MFVLSFDVGIKNLSWCLYDSDTDTVALWDVISVLDEGCGARKSKTLKVSCSSLSSILDRIVSLVTENVSRSNREREDASPGEDAAEKDAPCFEVLVEKQMRNRKMLQMEAFLEMFFTSRGYRTQVVSPLIKLKGVDQSCKGSANYRARKALSTTLTSNYISMSTERLHQDIIQKWSVKSKRDDLADSFLQARAMCGYSAHELLKSTCASMEL